MNIYEWLEFHIERLYSNHAKDWNKMLKSTKMMSVNMHAPMVSVRKNAT